MAAGVERAHGRTQTASRRDRGELIRHFLHGGARHRTSVEAREDRIEDPALEEFRAQLAPDLKLEAGYLLLRSREFESTGEIQRNLVDPDFAARALDPDPVPERILAMAGDALAGRFDVDPRKCDYWCPYRAVCRYHRSGNL